MSTNGSTGGAPSTGGGSTGSMSSGAPASSGVPASTGAQMMGWGEDWRQRLAAGSSDADQALQQLGRYASPEEVWKKTRELERIFSSGELVPKLKDGASAEEVSRYRKANGIPAEYTGYKINMPQGHEVTDEDKPFIEAFVKSAHAANFRQDQLDTALASFYSEVDRQEREMSEAEQAAVTKSDQELRAEWGGDYTLNMNLAESLLARAPAGFKDRFMNGYLNDHTPLRASKDMWKWLAQTEREINPAATVMPGQQGDLGATIETELASLKTMMANPTSEYWKGPKAEANQARYRQLIEAQAGLAKKGKSTQAA